MGSAGAGRRGLGVGVVRRVVDSAVAAGALQSVDSVLHGDAVEEFFGSIRERRRPLAIGAADDDLAFSHGCRV